MIYVTQSANLILFENGCKDDFMVVYLYDILIPKLRSLYMSSESIFVSEQKGIFLEKIGIEVIESIMCHNHITLEELEILIGQKIITRKYKFLRNHFLLRYLDK